MYLVNMFVEQLCMQQSVDVVESDFMNKTGEAKLEHKNSEAWHLLCIVRNIVPCEHILDSKNQWPHKYWTDNILVHNEEKTHLQDKVRLINGIEIQICCLLPSEVSSSKLSHQLIEFCGLEKVLPLKSWWKRSQ